MKWTAKIVNGKLELEGTSSDEAGATIMVAADGISSLFEIPQYGGELRPAGEFKNINDAIAIAEQWT